MKHKWDDTFKRLFSTNTPDFVAWLVPGAILLEREPLDLRPTTTVRVRNTDALYKILVDGEDELKKTGLKGLLPLCLLAEDGAQHKVAEEVFAVLKNQKELLTLALTLASMIFLREVDQHWLERQASMLEEIISDTWFYKYILQKGLAEGQQK